MFKAFRLNILWRKSLSLLLICPWNPIINAPEENRLIHSKSDQVDSQDNHIVQTKTHLAMKVAKRFHQDKRHDIAIYQTVPFLKI